MAEKKYVLAIDNGTTSTRAIIFDNECNIISSHQLDTTQIFPQSGWVEHDASEIWENTKKCVELAAKKAQLSLLDVSAIGITNQRETTVIWDRKTGIPIYNAIVWQDTRTQQQVIDLASRGLPAPDFNRLRAVTGLPLAAYFAASKISWLLDNVAGARTRALKGELAFGTIDTWLLWNLTSGQEHKTDVTNASRTMLMNLHTLQWDEELLGFFDIPRELLPTICPSSGYFGDTTSLSASVKVTGILGDQQAATFGQACFTTGDTKNTYGTGNFLIFNTGTSVQLSDAGLLTTVAYQVEGEPAHYALEGSVAVSGSLIQWLRDNIGLIQETREIETLAKSVEDNGGAYIVPAFSGLFAPYWRSDARGAVVGLTRYVNKAHLARAALESVAFQSVDVVLAAEKDTSKKLSSLRVDGGMTANDTLMQIQADLLGIPVVRPKILETTALGAAYAAGLAVGVWGSKEEISELWQEDRRWLPTIENSEAQRRHRVWQKAISKSLDWVDDDSPQN